MQVIYMCTAMFLLWSPLQHVEHRNSLRTRIRRGIFFPDSVICRLLPAGLGSLFTFLLHYLSLLVENFRFYVYNCWIGMVVYILVMERPNVILTS
jgi:hypothetical protein